MKIDKLIKYNKNGDVNISEVGCFKYCPIGYKCEIFYGIRIDIRNDLKFESEYIYVDDLIIMGKKKELIDNKKLMRGAKFFDDEWKKLINNHYIVYVITDTYVSYSLDYLKDKEYIEYKDWIVKEILE